LVVVITIKNYPGNFFWLGQVETWDLGHFDNFGVGQTFLGHFSTDLAEILPTYSLTGYIGEV